jgi:hypothetical protein
MIIYKTRELLATHSAWQKHTDLCACVRDADIATRVTFLGKLASEKLIQLGTENAIGDKLALFADLSGHVEDLEEATNGGVSTRDRPYHPKT